MNWQRARYAVNAPAISHHVTFGLMCVPAKYSCPGSPISFGEQVKVCRKHRFRPEQASWSKLGFCEDQSTSFQWGPMEVKASAPTIGLPYVCATDDACLTKNRWGGVGRCGEGTQNSLMTISLCPRHLSPSKGPACGPPDSGWMPMPCRRARAANVA